MRSIRQSRRSTIGLLILSILMILALAAPVWALDINAVAAITSPAKAAAARTLSLTGMITSRSDYGWNWLGMKADGRRRRQRQ